MIPLSTKMRPTKLEDFVGQKHFMYEGSLFYNSIRNKTFDQVAAEAGSLLWERGLL